MNEAAASPDLEQVLYLAEQEVTAVETGDLDKYLSLLSRDAVFKPQNVTAKTGSG
jgi:hypothetical protein